MKDIKKIEFTNTPPEVEKKEKEAEKIAEKEAEIQPVIEKEILEVLEPSKTPEQKTITRLWVVVGILAGIFMVQYGIFPITRAFKYTSENKENTDEITILKEWTDQQTKEAKEQRKITLCSKIPNAEVCKDVKQPTPTPTPVLKVIYPTP